MVKKVKKAKKSNKEIKEIRCLLCRTEFSKKEVKQSNHCPKCKTKAMPEFIADDVTINTNWHELRILIQFASQHAKTLGAEGAAVIEAISAQIRKYRPKEAPALTLLEEIKELGKEMGIDVQFVSEEEMANVQPTSSKLVN